jgi:hypothetical protein
VGRNDGLAVGVNEIEGFCVDGFADGCVDG